MKVSNNKIGGPGAKIDSAKSAKSDAIAGANKDVKAGAMQAKSSIKQNSNVDVSERAQMMQKAKGLASGDSIDEAKVARLQKMIDEGNYNVDADKIADRLVDEHLLIPD